MLQSLADVWQPLGELLAAFKCLKPLYSQSFYATRCSAIQQTAWSQQHGCHLNSQLTFYHLEAKLWPLILTSQKLSQLVRHRCMAMRFAKRGETDCAKQAGLAEAESSR